MNAENPSFGQQPDTPRPLSDAEQLAKVQADFEEVLQLIRSNSHREINASHQLELARFTKDYALTWKVRYEQELGKSPVGSDMHTFLTETLAALDVEIRILDGWEYLLDVQERIAKLFTDEGEVVADANIVSVTQLYEELVQHLQALESSTYYRTAVMLSESEIPMDDAKSILARANSLRAYHNDLENQIKSVENVLEILHERGEEDDSKKVLH